MISELNIQESRKTIIRKFLYAQVWEQGKIYYEKVGIPQGGPLSPLLSNLYLNKLDNWLDQKDMKFVRWADDILIFCKSADEAHDFLVAFRCYSRKVLKIDVHEDESKTKIFPITEKIPFLGFNLNNDRKEVNMTKIIKKWDERLALTSEAKILTGDDLNDLLSLSYGDIRKPQRSNNIFIQFWRSTVGQANGFKSCMDYETVYLSEIERRLERLKLQIHNLAKAYNYEPDMILSRYNFYVKSILHTIK